MKELLLQLPFAHIKGEYGRRDPKRYPSGLCSFEHVRALLEREIAINTQMTPEEAKQASSLDAWTVIYRSEDVDIARHVTFLGTDTQAHDFAQRIDMCPTLALLSSQKIDAYSLNPDWDTEVTLDEAHDMLTCDIERAEAASWQKITIGNTIIAETRTIDISKGNPRIQQTQTQKEERKAKDDKDMATATFCAAAFAKTAVEVGTDLVSVEVSGTSDKVIGKPLPHSKAQPNGLNNNAPTSTIIRQKALSHTAYACYNANRAMSRTLGQHRWLS